jgi:hypothetical protein
MAPAIEAKFHVERKKRAETIFIQILDGQLPADLRAELSALGCEDEGEAEARVEEWLTRHDLVLLAL